MMGSDLPLAIRKVLTRRDQHSIQLSRDRGASGVEAATQLALTRVLALERLSLLENARVLRPDWAT